MTGGVMSREKSRETRDRTLSAPESSRNTYYMTRGRRHQRTAALEMQDDRLPSGHKHWQPWRLTSIDTLVLRLPPPSITGERFTGRPAVTTWPGRDSLGHTDLRTLYLVFQTLQILNLCYLILFFLEAMTCAKAEWTLKTLWNS